MSACLACNRRSFLGKLIPLGGALWQGSVLAVGADESTGGLSEMLRLKVAEYPALGAEGGSLLLSHDAGATQLLVNRGPGDQFYVMDPTCTHLGCRVNRYEAAASQISCPCHGSSYAIDGQVTGGPAQRDLARFESRYLDGTLEVKVPGLGFGISGISMEQSASGGRRLALTFPTASFSVYRIRQGSGPAGPFTPVGFSQQKEGPLNLTQLTGNGQLQTVFVNAPEQKAFFSLELRIFEII